MRRVAGLRERGVGAHDGDREQLRRDDLGVGAAPAPAELDRLRQLDPDAAGERVRAGDRARSAGSAADAVRRSDAICSRRTRTGSVSVSGSAIAMPAGTSTNQRHDSGCSARTTSAATGMPTIVASAPTT